jgi:hypothetical protein
MALSKQEYSDQYGREIGRTSSTEMMNLKEP